MMRHVPARTQERADHTRSRQEPIYRNLASVRRSFRLVRISSAMTSWVCGDCVVRSATEGRLGGLINVHDHWGCKK